PVRGAPSACGRRGGRRSRACRRARCARRLGGRRRGRAAHHVYLTSSLPMPGPTCGSNWSPVFFAVPLLVAMRKMPTPPATAAMGYDAIWRVWNILPLLQSLVTLDASPVFTWSLCAVVHTSVLDPLIMRYFW